MGNQQGKRRPSNTQYKQTDHPELSLTFKQLTSGHPENKASVQEFQRLFGGHPNLGQLLFEHCLHSSGAPSNAYLDLQQFITYGRFILDLVTTSEQIEFYTRALAGGKENLSQKDVNSILELVFNVEWTRLGLQPTDFYGNEDPTIKSIGASLFTGGREVIPPDNLTRYLGQHLQGVYTTLHHYICAVLCGTEKPPADQCEEGASPSLTSLPTALQPRSSILSPCLAWVLSCTLGPTHLTAGDPQGDGAQSVLSRIMSEQGWHVLYDSDHDGMSPNRLIHHVFSYKGPTVLLVGLEGHCYCMAIDDEWKDGTTAFGSSHSLLLQVQPHYKAMSSEPNLVLFNTHSRVALKGLVIGKGNPRVVHVDEYFETAMHYGIPCKLQAIQVWGCGGESALKEQKSQKSWENKDIEKAKNRKLKIDDWKDSPDRQILELGGVTTEHAER